MVRVWRVADFVAARRIWGTEMNWQERAGKWICICVWGGMAYLLLRYALGALLPFLVASLVWAVLSPCIKRMAAVCHLPRKLCAFFLTVLVWMGLGCFLSAISARLIGEMQALLNSLRTEASFDSILSKLCFSMPEWLKNSTTLWSSEPWVQTLWKQLISAVTVSLASCVGKLLGATPSAFFGVVITVVASFYLTMDGDTLASRIGRMLPKGVRGLIASALPHARQIVGGYARALCLLFALTFLEVFVGLAILGRRYALLCALCIAAVDILPILGSGTVLIPWSVILFLQGKPTVGLGMLILYGVVTVVRQLTEPRLVGSGLGLHPLLSLFCMVMGLRLLGIWGMILCPITVALLVKILERDVQKKSIPAKKHLDIGEGL